MRKGLIVVKACNGTQQDVGSIPTASTNQTDRNTMVELSEFAAVETKNAVVYHASNLDVLPLMADNSVDSIVCDPPYELGFMGKAWDSTGIAYSVELWQECLRVLKPGGHLLAFSGSRTYHRMVVAIEDAGFEIRDMVSWISNKTFPKSHNIGKTLTKQGKLKKAEMWDGWGTALKPTVEPVVMARKPVDGTVADNVLAWGVGGLNIDASRIGTEERTYSFAGRSGSFTQEKTDAAAGMFAGNGEGEVVVQGRWPANVVFDEACAELLDEQSGQTKSGKPGVRTSDGFNANSFGAGVGIKAGESNGEYGDSGGASRFFYVARASKADRNEGVEANTHPTVKPTDLMRYLIKLVTPAGGVVLDPFTGSGSTGKAALLDGYQFIGIEMTADYLPIIEGRLLWAEAEALRVTQAAAEEEETRLF